MSVGVSRGGGEIKGEVVGGEWRQKWGRGDSIKWREWGKVVL